MDRDIKMSAYTKIHVGSKKLFLNTNISLIVMYVKCDIMQIQRDWIEFLLSNSGNAYQKCIMGMQSSCPACCLSSETLYTYTHKF